MMKVAGSDAMTLPLRSSLGIALFGVVGLSLGAQSPIGMLISEQSRTNFTVLGAGARAMGLGGAFIAVADDATAVSFNPAGLAQLLQPEVSLVARGTQRSVGYQNFTTTGQGRTLGVSDAVTGSTRFDPLFASATAPLRLGGRNLVLQLSIQRAFAQNEDGDRTLDQSPLVTGSGQPSHLVQSINQSGEIDLYSLAVAYEVSQRILLGAAYNQWRGRWNLESSSVQTSSLSTTALDFRQTNALDGGNFNFGLIWRWPSWSLGLVHQTGFHADYTFSTTLATSLPRTAGRPAPVTTGLHWPSSTGLGFAYRPGDRWLVTSDLTHTLWSTARYMSGSTYLNGQRFFDFDKGDRTPNATSFHLGVEYLWLTDRNWIIPLRAGVSREPQPVLDRYTGEQRVMKWLSFGSGFKRGALGLDVAYRYGWSRRQASQFLEIDQILSHTPPTSIGTERIHEHRVDLSLNVRFDRRPVERALRYLFVGGS